MTNYYYHVKVLSGSSAYKEKVALEALLFHICVRIYKPDSVPTSDVGDDHLSCFAVAGEIFAVQTILLWNTTLRVGKDFAVSLLPSDRIIPEGIRGSFELGVTARTSMLAHGGRYPLPSYK